MPSNPWVVAKFGGTSVATVERWTTIAERCAAHLAAGRRPLLVCSAVSGISDLLETLPDAAVTAGPEPILATIEDKHRLLAASMDLDAQALLGSDFEGLRRLAEGVALLGEASAATRARILAYGELMSTRLGTAFLEAQGIDCAWQDARGILTSAPDPRVDDDRNLLSAVCEHGFEERLAARLADLPNAAIITQGFIASDPRGRTVLLGRGGSDTAAAYMAAKIGALRCEIWTDVPGLFTANPRQVPQARLLRALTYNEAQEIASTGAKVLHPRCILPLREAGIPLWVRWSERPDFDGTVISAEARPMGAQVKSVSAKGGLVLIAMDTMGMWQQVGFLADAFACFQRCGLSVDVVSTSESNVSVTLDPLGNNLSRANIERLLAELRAVCKPRAIDNVASVSLVGSRIRGVLHRLGPAFEVFEEQPIHLVSQGSGDLNLTFVVDQEQVDRLVLRLHAMLFDGLTPNEVFGPTWTELIGSSSLAEEEASFHRGSWWWPKRNELVDMAAQDGPLYVYDLETVRARARSLVALGSVARAMYAVKANWNPAILRALYAEGIAFECVSQAEVEHVLATLPECPPERILFTPNFAPRSEYAFALQAGVHLTVDSLHPLRSWPELFRGQEIFCRLDPGHGRGHHKHVRTGGEASKFGIARSDFEELQSLVQAANVRVVGLHAHSGSGIRSADNWLEVASFLLTAAEDFPDARVLDVGGGLGVPERAGQSPLNLAAVDALLADFVAANPAVELWIEPGRFLVAECGVLLARVTQVKRKGDSHYVGIETGMNSLIRPALYGAYHPIVNLSRADQPPAITATIVGPICESGDTLGYQRRLPETQEGDVLLIGIAGAYGRSMSSTYNLRPPAREVALGDELEAGDV